jgi:ATP-dependent helicase HrpB
MFSRHTFHAMTPNTPPEILDSDLSPLVLELVAWGVTDPSSLSWLDPPPAAALSAARQLLADLSAVDDAGRVTVLGSAMARLPLHPRLARLLLRAQDIGCPGTGCDLAALLSERDIVRRSAGGSAGGRNVTTVDERLELLRQWRSTGRTGDQLDTGALRSVERVSGQLRRLLGGRPKTPSDSCGTDTLCRLLLAAYPDRIARLREADEGRYLLANGRGARLVSGAAVTRIPLLIAVSVAGADQGEGVIHIAETVTEELLRSELGKKIETRDEIAWDSREGRIVAVRGQFIAAVPLSSAAFSPGPEAQLPVVIEALRASELGLLSRNEAFLQLQARLQLVRQAFPGDGWPDTSDAALLKSLENWLAPFIGGVRNAQQLATVNCAAALLSLLDYRQRLALDELAPTHLTVPSGSRIRLDYCGGELPVLAVKLQELFGLAETPTIAGGRVAVLLHLLSPAGRPLQVTSDLKGFWDGSYHQVKKEMKGRYPKHPWPDDPWSALPTRRAKPKGT